MAPLVETFPPRLLTSKLQYHPDGSYRKKPVKLPECKLKELIQYECNLSGPKNDPRTKVVCEPVLRLFRCCADGLTVETTAWEGFYDEKGGRVEDDLR